MAKYTHDGEDVLFDLGALLKALNSQWEWSEYVDYNDDIMNVITIWPSNPLDSKLAEPDYKITKKWKETDWDAHELKVQTAKDAIIATELPNIQAWFKANSGSILASVNRHDDASQIMIRVIDLARFAAGPSTSGGDETGDFLRQM